MKTRMFTIFCIFSRIGAILETKQDNVNMLTSCVVKMLRNIDYKSYGDLMDITVMNVNNDLKLSALHKVEGARFVSRRFFWNPGTISNVIYIVMSDNFEELENGLNEVTLDKFWNPSARFIIILQSFENHSLHDVTDLLHTYNIFREVSLLSRDSNDYTIYKFNFTSPGYCLKSGHLTFWSWCSDFQSEKEGPGLFKGSIRNCRFKFIARNLWPFMNFDTSIEGVEQYFISLFQKHYKIKLDLQEFTKLDKYGKSVSNLTSLMIKKVASNEAEGAVGGYAITSEYFPWNVSHTYPMTIDHMFYVLAHANYVEQWVAVLYQSFSTCVVVGILFILFCIAATLLSIFCTQRDISYNILIVFGYLLNKTCVKRVESGWPQALIFSSLLFTAFIIPYAIQANLYSVTTQPVRGYEPREPEDLKDYKPVLYHEWQHRNQFEGYWDCGSRINCLMMVKNCPTKNLYTVVSGTHYSVFEWQLGDDQCKLAMYRLREPYVTTYRAIYLRRGSVLVQPFDHFMLQIAATGIMRKYSSDIYFRELLKCKSHYRSEHVPLKLANLYNVYMILFGGYCLCVLVFICEVSVGQYKALGSS